MYTTQQVLNHGFVRLIETMPDYRSPVVEGVPPMERAVVQAARVSMGQGSKGAVKDRALINYLINNSHSTPLEHAVFKFHVKMPIFVARQWTKHRLGSFECDGQGLIESSGHSINEISYRYTEAQEEFYVPDNVRFQDDGNKQKSIEAEPDYDGGAKRYFVAENLAAYETYKHLLANGIAREQARSVLPVGTYTQFYWTCNARAMFHWLSLRNDDHAQFEIHQYGKIVDSIVSELMPWTHEAFSNNSSKGSV